MAPRHVVREQHAPDGSMVVGLWYIGDGLAGRVVFLPTELAFRWGALLVADRSQHLQQQIDRNGVVSLLRQQ
jgi:hypothetical protein